MKLNFPIVGGDFTNAGQASSEVKKILKQLDVDPTIVKRVVVAMYEAEVNVVAHAYQGEIEVYIETDRVQVKITDKGPGIPNIEEAMKAGFSTASQKVREMGFGAGMGLPNMKKNSDIFDISSIVNQGTCVTLTTFLNPSV